MQVKILVLTLLTSCCVSWYCDLRLQANDEATLLKDMLIALGFSKPPDGITSFVLFSKVESKVCYTLNADIMYKWKS